MRILHGTWSAPTFYLWGERIESRAADGVPEPDADAAVRRHPFVLSTAELHETLGELSRDGLLASIAEEADLSLWLPCVGGCPLPSHGAASARQTRPSHLAAFSVPALAFSPADTVDLLTGLSDGALRNCGDSVRYWRALARYVRSLLARRQFAPDVDEVDEEAFSGRWRVFIADRQAFARLDRFVRAMPPVCRAIATSDPAARRATRLVDTFIAEAAEAVIRRCLSIDPFFEQIQRRAETEGKWELNWLAALLGPRRRVSWAGEDGPAVAAQIRSWIGQLEQDAIEAPPELRFTLVEPESGDEAAADADSPAWRVRFDLYDGATGERLDIARVWQEQSDAPAILGRHLINHREQLHGQLLRAASVCDVIKSALALPVPSGVALNTHEATRFIHEWAPLLQAQGFKVQLPGWATERNRRLGLELFIRPPDDPSSGGSPPLDAFGLDTMLAFDWRVAVGDERLSLDEFEALTARGTHLVRLQGRWVDIDQAAAGKTLAFMRQRPRGRLSLAQAIRLAAGVEGEETGLPILGLKGSAWIDRFLGAADEEKLESLEQPEGFTGTMRPYQLRGLAWLAFLDRLGIGACLADDMGLGKTIQLLALLLHERREAAAGRRSRPPGPTLLFVPMSVIGNWQRETQRFAGRLRVLVHHGPERLAGEAFAGAARRHDLVITTYGLAYRDLKTLQRVPWHRIALDEAQKIKNPSANQTLAVRSLNAPHRVALTGTPLENHLSELWSIMEMLNPGLLGSAAAFRRQFAVPIEKMGDEQRADQLSRMIRPFLLRRLKTDPKVECDLPDKMEMRVYCNLTVEQAALYKQTIGQMLESIDGADGIRRRGMILATLTKLKQVCNHPAHLLRDDAPLSGRSGKCERVVEMLEEVIEEGDAALIFTQYKEMGNLLVRLFAERLRTRVLFLHGGTPAAQRTRMVDQFQDPDSGVGVFLLSLKAGGFGLNLTRANHVFHFDRWWNPAVEEQATDRAHRIGQTRRVQVHKLVCIGTIEDRIDKLLAEKAAMADRIIGGGDDWLTGLSTSELRNYLALSPEAVTEADDEQ
ncbi:MAG: DEAD/DEAH box helicase [Phycisphaerae bacterium]